jgi:hypothetical protein
MWVQTNNNELKNIRKQTKDLTKIKKEKDDQKLINQSNSESKEMFPVFLSLLVRNYREAGCSLHLD